MTYYLKYRSKTIDELDLKDVRESLSNIIKSGQIPHAFLFSGPKGSGKTSAARIIAKIVNCDPPSPRLRKGVEPCNQCDQCVSISRGSNIDVIEVDAASHRGIDDIRTLRDAVKLAPAHAKKKVYIIDEAHMLTTEASNALLKTLEEPPDHVIFILATTNPEKLIETIRSRTVNIHFSKANDDEIVRSLQRVVKAEKLKADDETLYVIASASGGSFRDAVKLLEELVIGKIKLGKETVEEYLFKRKAFDVDAFLKILADGGEKQAYSAIEKAVESGVSIKNLTVSVLDQLRKMLLAKVGIVGEDDETFTKKELLELIGLISRSYAEVGYAVIEQIPLELAISEWYLGKSEIRNPKSEIKENLNGSNGKKDINDSNKIDQKNSGEKTKISRKVVRGICSLDGFDDNVWTQILTEIKPINASTEALLRAAKPVEYDGKTLKLGVYYKFHKEKLETNQHRSLLEGVLKNVVGNGVKVVCMLTEPPRKSVNNGGLSKTTEEIVVTETETVLTEGEDEEIVKIAKEIFG